MTDLDRLGFVESEDALHEAARRAVGLDGFGDPSYRTGLRAVLAAYDREARLHANGRRMARRQIVQILEQRLRAEQAWKDDPGVLRHEVGRPIIITGCVRTGSTALHHLMAQVPSLQKLEYWLAQSPQPRPPRAGWEAHPDFRTAQAEIDAMYAADPSLKAMHFMSPDGPEECRHFLAQSFTDDCFEVNSTVPSYEEWYHHTPHPETYRRHRKLVQLVGSTDPTRRWLLKYPVHLRQLDALLEVYPDACIVQTHRDPRQVLPSYVNLVAGFRALWEHDIDRRDIAGRQLRGWSRAANRALEVRATRDRSQFFDLFFAEFVADPVGCVQRICQHFGHDLSAEGVRRIRDWNASNPQHKHGRHEYSGEGTGLTEQQILEAFGPYLSYFGLEP